MLVSPLFKGTISIGNTSEPTIDFQGTCYCSFSGSIDEKSCAVVEKSFIWGGKIMLLLNILQKNLMMDVGFLIGKGIFWIGRLH